VVISYTPLLQVAPPVTESWNLSTGTREWQRPGLLAQPVFTSDGHYFVAQVATGGPPAFTVTDAVSGATFTVPLGFTPMVAHPRATAVFGLMRDAAGADVARIDGGGLTVYGGARPARRNTRMSRSTAGSCSWCARQRAGRARRAVWHRDASRIGGRDRAGRQVASNHDGSRAVVIRGPHASSGDIAVIDTVTGSALATTVFRCLHSADPGDCVSGALAGVSPDRSQIVIACSWIYRDPFGGPLTFTAIAPARRRHAWLGSRPWCQYYPSAVAISPDNTQAFTLSTHPRGFSVFERIALPAATTTGAFAPSAARPAVAFAPLARRSRPA
jgi:hypothetical protein